MKTQVRIKKGGRSSLFLLTLLVILSYSGCADRLLPSAYVKDGKEYGKVKGAFFGHQWWHYYERAISYADGEFYEEALEDLKEAVDRRKKDQRMARTYGMHFIDYFPHRELGIVYYQISDLEKAKTELEKSLRQFPSAKARFYLDRVRKALLEQEAEELPPPALTIDITDEVWTRQDPVVISGVAEDKGYVAGITITGKALFLDGSKKRVPFKEALDLSQGPHTVEVVAKNLLGKTTTRQATIHVDREGPIVTLDELHSDRSEPQGEIRISGSIYDEAGVSDLRINGQPILTHKGTEIPFTARLSITDSLSLVASDRLGNRTSARIPFFNPQSRLPVLLACADLDVESYCVAVLFGTKDTSPPIIRLKGWTDKQTVFLEKVYIEGCVSSERTIERLSINQIPLLRRQGTHIFFGHMAELKKGKNVLTVEARDEAGNIASRQIIVIRRVPKALHLAERMSLTALPFEQKGVVSNACLAFQDNLIDALVDLNRFRVVERDKLDVILHEQKLSRTKLFDRPTALKLGKLVAAQSVITGSIIETRMGIEAVARLIDTETSEILSAQDVYNEVKDLPSLGFLAEGMAVKFHQDFPLVDGLVIEHKGDDIFTDLGQDVIKLGRKLIIYRENPIRHPVTGKAQGADNAIIGRARVTQVMPEMSKAQLLERTAKAIRRMDKVITE
jgi:tetratricopeptide (TPR) repeat protein/TolB-like protein